MNAIDKIKVPNKKMYSTRQKRMVVMSKCGVMIVPMLMCAAKQSKNTTPTAYSITHRDVETIGDDGVITDSCRRRDSRLKKTE